MVGRAEVVEVVRDIHDHGGVVPVPDEPPGAGRPAGSRIAHPGEGGKRRLQFLEVEQRLGGAGVGSWFEITGDRLVAFRRGSKQGGSLVFLINVEDRIAKTTVKPRWGITTAHDPLNDQALALADGAFEIEVAYGEVGVVHCADG